MLQRNQSYIRKTEYCKSRWLYIITRYLRSSSDVIESSLPGEENDSFWGEFNNNRRVNTKDVVRVVTNERDEDFEYGNISFDDIETDDDYQET